jgi:hypothetical protein
MDNRTAPPTADRTEEGVDDYERACRDPYASAGVGDDSLDVDHVGVRAWVASLFSR